MKSLVFGCLSALLLVSAIAPTVQAQTPGSGSQNAPLPQEGVGGTNQPNGSTNQRTPNRTDGTTSPNTSDRPGMAGETDQGVPGVTNQQTPGDPDRGGTNNQGVPAFPDQGTPNNQGTPDNLNRPTPGRTNQSTPSNLNQGTVPGTNPSGYVSQFQPNPFQLVNLARNGYLESAGIPNGATLVTSYREGEISAEDLVRGAISLNRLSPDTANDDSYIRFVDQQMWGLEQHIDNN